MWVYEELLTVTDTTEKPHSAAMVQLLYPMAKYCKGVWGLGWESA